MPGQHVQQFAFDYWRSGRDPTKRIVSTVDDLWEVVRYVEKFPDVAYDTETSGLAWYLHASICGAALAVRDPNRSGGTLAWYLPTRHHTTEQQLPAEEVARALSVILGSPTITKVVHNLKFERHMARKEGIEITGPCRDVAVEAHLFDENFAIGLKPRITRDLGDVHARASELVIKHLIAERAKQGRVGIEAYLDEWGYSQLPVGIAGFYACHDVDGTLRLADFYDRNNVRSFFSTTYETEIALSEALFEMEQWGMPIDRAYLEWLREDTGRVMEGTLPHIHAMAGMRFNPGSDEELRHVLIHRLGATLTKRTKSARFDDDTYDESKLSVDADVLSELAPKIPVCALIMKWRDARKINSTYTESILKRLDKNDVLHGDFRSLGTNTGRTSSANPNMQNFASDSDERAIEATGKRVEDGGLDPWSVKRAFVNRGPGYKRKHLDYSQIELRVLAHYTQDPTMLEVYRTGQDIHERTSLEVFNTKEKWARRPSKVINFGLCLNGDVLALVREAGTVRLVRLDQVRADHLVWDGIDWVAHDGLVCRGEQEVVSYEGIEATPEHVVYLEGGGKARLGCVASEETPRRLARGADGLTPLRYDSEADREGAPHVWSVPGCGACVWCLREAELDAPLHGRSPRTETRVVKVYDLLNAGPRRRFTVSGKIVSNSYCLSAAGFSAQADIPLADAERHMEKFFQQYPRIAPFRQEFWAYVRSQGGVFRNVFGRPRRVPALLSGSNRDRARAERQTIGSLIQGSAAELTKVSIVRIHEWEKRNRTGLRLATTIHDDIGVDIPDVVEREATLAVKAMMEDFSSHFPTVPIVVDVDSFGQGESWSQKKKWKP